MRILLSILVLGIVGTIFVHSAYGHGVGSETLPPQMIGNYNSTILLKSWPNNVNEDNPEKIISMTIYEIDSGEHLHNMKVDFTVSKNEDILFSDDLRMEEGELSLVFLFSSDVGIEENVKSMIDNILGRDSNQKYIDKNIFSEGGLYDFDIVVSSVDSFENDLEKPAFFNGALSIPKKFDYQTESDDKVSITSFYDVIDSFSLTSDSLKFSMPFEWDEENVSQVSVVHEEIHIPKSMSSWIVGDYYLEINGITATDSIITIDDYSAEEDRIIHFIIPQRYLLDFKDDLQQMRFELRPTSSPAEPLSAPTRNNEYDVQLQWNSGNIVWGKPIAFEVLIEDTFVPSKVVKKIPFHVSMIQEDKIIFEKRIDGVKNTESKLNAFEFTFEESHEGTVKLLIEDIDSNEYASTEFAFVVGAPTLKFPITIPSQTSDGVRGNYDVDMTWIPADLIPDEESEFIFTIYNKDTRIHVPNAYYEFVVIQDGDEIVRREGVAPGGGYFEDIVFSESNAGDVLIRIDKINGSEEYAEILVNVIPEFGSISILILAVSLFALLITIRKPSLFRYLVH